jgi:nucleoside-diphosphate-sugar epimerase
MRIFITGINGFVARNLAAHLIGAGHTLRGSSRSPSDLLEVRRWEFGDPLDETMFQGDEVLIHCSHDFTRGAMYRNIDGTLALANAARRAGVRRQVFMSSLSARADARSEYGRSKFEIEKVFLERGDTIVRPGTVIGKGGLFGKMAEMIRTKSVLPLVDGGKAEMTVIAISDLCRAMGPVLGRAEPREYNLYYPEKPTMKQLLVRLREKLGSKTLFLPTPAWMLLVPLTILRWLHIRTPIDVDNLRGYMKSKEQIHASTLSLVLEKPSTIEEALSEV